ncbi:MAG TPA: hypothetical protein VM938_13030 [Acidimicrobiales bacterium]|nr:hypothetical protein [Acidimicrobiales bacterium]
MRRNLWGALAVALALVAPPPASAAENAEFSLRPDRPATAEARDRSYVVRTVEPGAEFSDRLLAVNLTDKPIELDVAPVDATITGDGQFAPGTATQADGRWLTVTPARVRVPARGTTPVSVRVKVPADAAEGDHIAAVVAQKAGPPTGSGNVQLVQRVGVRVYLTVQSAAGESGRTGGLARTFEFKDLRWAGDAFEVDVQNTGDLLVEPLGTLTISRGGLDGSTDLPVLGTVPPREQRTFKVPPPKPLEPGTYDARMKLRLVQGGADQERSLTFTFDGALKAADDADDDKKRDGLPWWLILLSMVALAAVAVEARRRMAA